MFFHAVLGEKWPKQCPRRTCAPYDEKVGYAPVKKFLVQLTHQLATMKYSRHHIKSTSIHRVFNPFFSRYYEFDPLVVRELLGKKLTSKQRKDLDDVSEKTKVPLKSCRRQVILMWLHFLSTSKKNISVFGTCNLESCSLPHFWVPSGLWPQCDHETTQIWWSIHTGWVFHTFHRVVFSIAIFQCISFCLSGLYLVLNFTDILEKYSCPKVGSHSSKLMWRFWNHPV